MHLGVLVQLNIKVRQILCSFSIIDSWKAAFVCYIYIYYYLNSYPTDGSQLDTRLHKKY